MAKISIHFKPQQGLTLIELLISMLLGTIVLIAAAQVVISIGSSKRLLSAETELQENARFGLSFISSIVQGSGGFGCRIPEQANTQSILDFDEPTFTPTQAIEGWEADNSGYGDVFTAQNKSVTSVATGPWSSSDGAVMSSDISSVESSDVLKVWYMEGDKGALNSVANGTLSFSELDIDEGDVVIINDCRTLTFAQACSCENAQGSTSCTGSDISEGSCNNPGNVDHSFDDLNFATAEIGILQQAIFYVSTPDGSADGIPTLYVAHLGNNGKHGTPEEVLSGIENLQVLYGQDTSGDHSPNNYVSADAVVDWKKVVSVKVSLLLRSKENRVLPETQKLFFNGAQVSIAEGDLHLRRVYNLTISLRNRNVGY